MSSGIKDRIEELMKNILYTFYDDIHIAIMEPFFRFREAESVIDMNLLFEKIHIDKDKKENPLDPAMKVLLRDAFLEEHSEKKPDEKRSMEELMKLAGKARSKHLDYYYGINYKKFLDVTAIKLNRIKRIYSVNATKSEKLEWECSNCKHRCVFSFELIDTYQSKCPKCSAVDTFKITRDEEQLTQNEKLYKEFVKITEGFENEIRSIHDSDLVIMDTFWNLVKPRIYTKTEYDALKQKHIDTKRVRRNGDNSGKNVGIEGGCQINIANLLAVPSTKNVTRVFDVEDELQVPTANIDNVNYTIESAVLAIENGVSPSGKALDESITRELTSYVERYG